jgi:uncharacterized protein
MANQALWHFEIGNSGWIARGRFFAVRCLLWAAFLYATFFALLVVSVFGGQWLHLPGYAQYAVGIVVPLLSFLLYAVLIHAVERRAPSEIFFEPGSFIDLIVGAVIGCVILTLMLLLLVALGLYSVRFGHGKDWLNSFVFGSYISGTLEELAFRAALLRLFARMFNPVAGLLISSALFGMAHLTHATLFQAAEVAFNAGLTLGLPYMLTGRLWMSVGLHTGWDFFETSVLGVNTQDGVFLSVPVAGQPAYLTGGAYGPDGSLLASLIAAIAVVAMVYAGRRGWLSSRSPAAPFAYAASARSPWLY